MVTIIERHANTRSIMVKLEYESSTRVSKIYSDKLVVCRSTGEALL